MCWLATEARVNIPSKSLTMRFETADRLLSVCEGSELKVGSSRGGSSPDDDAVDIPAKAGELCRSCCVGRRVFENFRIHMALPSALRPFGSLESSRAPQAGQSHNAWRAFLTSPLFGYWRIALLDTHRDRSLATRTGGGRPKFIFAIVRYS